MDIHQTSIKKRYFMIFFRAFLELKSQLLQKFLI